MPSLTSLLCRKAQARNLRKERRRWEESRFAEVVEQICRMRAPDGGARFLQIGANDGVTNDPLHAFIVDHQLTGIAVEPLPAAHERLQQTYAGQPQVRCLCMAVGAEPGTVTLYVAGLPEGASESAQLDAGRKATFSQATALRKTRKACGLETDEAAADRLRSVNVPCETLPGLLHGQGWSTVDILQIDAEGEDWTILRQADEMDDLPALINVEHKGLTPDERNAMGIWFAERGYVTFDHGRDTCAVRVLYPNVLKADMDDRPQNQRG